MSPESNEEILKGNLADWEPVDRQEKKDKNSHLQQGENYNVDPAITEATGEWEPIVKQEETYWQNRINKAVGKIKTIQAGGEVTDE